VIAIHDTTSCAFSHADPAVIGYLNTGKPGFMVHYSLVVDGDGSKRPLGITNVEVIWVQIVPRQAASARSAVGSGPAIRCRSRTRVPVDAVRSRASL